MLPYNLENVSGNPRIIGATNQVLMDIARNAFEVRFSRTSPQQPPRRNTTTSSASSVGSQSTSSRLIISLALEKDRLRSHLWSDRQVRDLPNEDLAKLAFDMSNTLSKEFKSQECFLAYWRGVRR